MKNHSMLSEIWRRFKKNKQALVGLIVLILFVLIAIFADQIAPYGYDDQDASRAMIAPCAEHIFGTDNLGRDQLSRLIYGSRYSLAIGFLAVGISVITGGILGVLAAYYPKLDNIIMRCMDLFMAIPQMLLAMCIVTALGSSLFNLMLAVGLSSTPKFARVVRAAVMSTREQEFVEAARAIGANNWRIIVHHILPKRPRRFFLTIFRALWPYPLQSASFPSLFEHKVSACSAALCGGLCGQTVGAVGLAIRRFAQMWSNCGLPFLPQKLTVPLFYMLSQSCF